MPRLPVKCDILSELKGEHLRESRTSRRFLAAAKACLGSIAASQRQLGAGAVRPDPMTFTVSQHFHNQPEMGQTAGLVLYGL